MARQTPGTGLLLMVGVWAYFFLSFPPDYPDYIL